MIKNNFSRILIDLVLLLSVIYGWWVVAVVVSLVAILYFNNFFELIIFGLIFDALFGFNENLGIFGFAGLIFSVSVYLIFYWLKKILRK